MAAQRTSLKNTPFQWRAKDIFYLAVYISILLILAMNLPKSLHKYYMGKTLFIGFGILGIWRYSWWSLQVVRSLIYKHIVFPQRRQRADKLWESGWRPKRLFFMFTTFREVKETTETVLQSIINECRDVGMRGQLFIGTGCETDERVIEQFFAKCSGPIPLDVVMVREKAAGKRYAISSTLEVMMRHGLEKNDPVVFMDGDTYFYPGCLQKCLPFFQLYPKMQALTTYEQATVINGPHWMKRWLEMRFAQRDLTMQSHALSNKVLTLTGRMSIFRGNHLLEPGFIDILENDHLTHWLWGKFRFLSGDDKSTCYYLLKAGADIFYIPDACTITLENITGSPTKRMFDNLKRWCGNTLRNNGRTIALGPRNLGYFMWWCLIDQRISIWTMFIGHLIALVISLTKSLSFLLVTILWVGFSRLCLSTVLFYHARRIDITFPFVIYFNQLTITVIKIYLLFRLPQQRWVNRTEQSLGFSSHKQWRRRTMVANLLTLFYCCLFLVSILLYLDVVSMISLGDVMALAFS